MEGLSNYKATVWIACALLVRLLKSPYAARFDIHRTGTLSHRKTAALFLPAPSRRPEAVALRAVARHNLAIARTVIRPSG